ncbi:methyltransferase [Cystoisospora suis]|uniref:Methyltransferase n=1 Tax=Cystoisospora suis TaxID=483139 RepID=A0A2C6KIC5_9APIC|nr:methyltransferase [Cystoisospora suis]
MRLNEAGQLAVMEASFIGWLFRQARTVFRKLIFLAFTVVLAVVRVSEEAVVSVLWLLRDRTCNAVLANRLRFFSTFISPPVVEAYEDEPKRKKHHSKKNSGCPYLPHEIQIAHDASERRFLVGFEPRLCVRCIMRWMSMFPRSHAAVVYAVACCLERLSYFSDLARGLLQLWGYVAVRSTHFESFVMWALTEKRVEQVLVIGAGFDTRVYRCAKLIREENTMFFELDLPHIQRSKCRKLLQTLRTSDLGQALRYLRMIPFDIRTNDIREKLRGSGVRQDVNTIVVLEGVSPYVPIGDLARLFEGLQSHFSTKSKHGQEHGRPEVFLLMDYLRDGNPEKAEKHKHEDHTSEAKTALLPHEGREHLDRRWRPPVVQFGSLFSHNVPEKWNVLPADPAEWADSLGWKEVCRTTLQNATVSLKNHRYGEILRATEALPAAVSLFQTK